MQIRNKIWTCLAVVQFMTCAGETGVDIVAEVRDRLGEMIANTPANDMRYGIIEEQICFDSFHRLPEYVRLADTVSNDWRAVLANLSKATTNRIERMLILCVSLQYDENFYIDFCSELCDMRTNGTVSVRELETAMASHRYDIDSCLIRRYNEKKVINLINKFKLALPEQTNYWDRVLSGEAYTNYLEEVEMGMWR